MFSNMLTDASPMKVKAFHKKQQKTYISWRAYTKTSPVFDEIRQLFYSSGKKIVPKNIKQLLTSPLSLAVWHMDDGYKRNDCNAFRINTDSFSREEHELLRETLRANFGIQSSIHRKGKYLNLYIPQKYAQHFVGLIQSHIVPSLSYKIALAP